MKKRGIVAVPLWYLTSAPVARRDRVAHVTYYDGTGEPVCGASLHGQADACVGRRFRKCSSCVEWLRARGQTVPAIAATFADTEVQP